MSKNSNGNSNSRAKTKNKSTTKKSLVSVPFLPDGYEGNVEKYVKAGLKNPNRNLNFEHVLKMTQSELKSFLKTELTSYGYKPTSGNGYLYCKGEIPVMLVAHMDTVHKEKPRDIVYSDKYVTSPQGIGGDDRCGVYMILKIVTEIRCHVLFTEDEESGCIGARLFSETKRAEKLRGKLNFIIELDRRGENDAVFYYCGNEDFKEFVETNSIFREEYGSYSDICEIAPVLDASAVNISCGYFNEHTKSEYVNLGIMERNIESVKELINADQGNRFEWKDEIPDLRWGYSDYENPWEKTVFEILYENGSKWATVVAGSDDEAVGKFMRKHPHVTYDDIVISVLDRYEPDFAW